MRKILLLLPFSVFLFGANLDIGTAAPNFELKDQDGVVHKLNDYKGKKLVIYFFQRQRPLDELNKLAGSAMNLITIKLITYPFSVLALILRVF